MLEEVRRENERVRWPERQPYAFWKGNANVCGLRRDLMRCNKGSDSGRDWNARLFRQDWGYANRNGFKDSNLAKQCTYRYPKITNKLLCDFVLEHFLSKF